MSNGIQIVYSEAQACWVAFVAAIVPASSVVKAQRWALDHAFLPRLKAAPAGERRDAMKTKVDELVRLTRAGEAVAQFVQTPAGREVALVSNDAGYVPRKLISLPTGAR